MKRSIMIHVLLSCCAMVPSLSFSAETCPCPCPCPCPSSPGAAAVRRRASAPPPPIVYTIAGSDSGGGAGIQADLHAIHAMECHGCSAITCLTAQNSVGVTAVHAPPASFLREQLIALNSDLPPRAIKIGMLGTRELAEEVGSFLSQIIIDRGTKTQKEDNNKIWVVLDPVMISTSGHRLIEEDAQASMIEHVFPFVDLLTPNLHEAEALLGGRKIQNAHDVEQAARDLLQLGAGPGAGGVSAVLIKGGHIATDDDNNDDDTGDDNNPDRRRRRRRRRYAQDYLLAKDGPAAVDSAAEARLCDASRGIWLRSTWIDSKHTHGTGCTLSSAIASALALGERERCTTTTTTTTTENKIGSSSSIYLTDACCLAKAYVTEGIRTAVPLGQGPGPVGQTRFPSSHQSFTSIVQKPHAPPLVAEGFRRMKAFGVKRRTDDHDCPELGRLLPIVDSAEWIQNLCRLDGITDVQLRIKGTTSKERVAEIVRRCQSLCERAGIRLWVNDHFEAAIAAKCFGVHMGQEDLVRCMMAKEGGLSLLRLNNIALGISTHSYGELAVALGLRPTYISLGPVFCTTSKKVGFDTQGSETVTKWRQLVPPDIPLVAIGGINGVQEAAAVRAAGADCIAVIGAITKATDAQIAVTALNKAMVS